MRFKGFEIQHYVRHHFVSATQCLAKTKPYPLQVSILTDPPIQWCTELSRFSVSASTLQPLRLSAYDHHTVMTDTWLTIESAAYSGVILAKMAGSVTMCLELSRSRRLGQGADYYWSPTVSDSSQVFEIVESGGCLAAGSPCGEAGRNDQLFEII